MSGDALVAKRVRMARAGARLSQIQLAEEVSKRAGTKISREVIRRIEDEDRDVELGLLRAIADATGEPFEWLAGVRTIPGSQQVNRVSGGVTQTSYHPHSSKPRLHTVPAVKVAARRPDDDPELVKVADDFIQNHWGELLNRRAG